MSVSGVLRNPGESARLFVSVPLEGRNCLLVEQDLSRLIEAVLPGDGQRILMVRAVGTGELEGGIVVVENWVEQFTRNADGPE